MLQRLKPFRSLPNAKEVWAWGMYDLANQSFTLLVITLLFPIYFRQVMVEDGARGDVLWSIAGSTGLLLSVLAAPVLGAMADSRGWKKRMLMTTGVVCVALTCCFALVPSGWWLLAMAIFIPANFCYQIGENFLASFLPEISTSRNIGHVSAIGWTMGYIGALLLLVFTALQMQLFGWQATENWGGLFVFAGLWFAAGMVAPWIILKETPAYGGEAAKGVGGAVKAGFGRLGETVRSAKQYAQVGRFLLAFFAYSLGVQTMIYFAVILADDFGFQQLQLVLFVLQLTVTAGIAAIVTGMIQDRIGARTTVMIFLGVWIVTALSMLILTLPEDPPTWTFWIIGNGVGLGLGGIGTSSRALLGRFTPKHKTAEFFGLWGMTYKGAGVIGVLSFGQVRGLVGSSASLILLTTFFVAGAILLLRVNDKRGMRAARASERKALKDREESPQRHSDTEGEKEEEG
ncbi:MAG: MFS transporter [Phycisphaeraceae bacterium]|nr:MAG: MFS transporter [Phycisphaeraceae bacterium]